MKRNTRHYLMLGLGWVFIVLGILGLFLPILQGILFIAIGLIILSRRSPRVRLLIRRLAKRYPAFGKGLVEARIRAEALRRRFFTGKDKASSK
jgi:uncharacterized membrane protein YbaN (DUF454 family)